jgi:hypothetical protein
MLILLSYRRYVVTLLVALVILIVYLSTLQTIPNGSSHPYMIDVGETQIALNIWGTLHTTGYPLYTILGNLFTPLPQIFGVNPAAAASLYSTFWSTIALVGFYLFVLRLVGRHEIAAVAVLLLALTRSIWIHSLIAEVYSLSLAILIGIWLILVYPLPFQKQVWGLALLLGIGVAHHRALVFCGFGIAFVVLPVFWRHRQRLLRILLGTVGLFLLGFLPYLYLPLRADSAWSYSRDLDTWDGFWFHFWGKEADYLVRMPSDLKGWLENFTGTIDILIHEITLPGLVIAILSLAVAGILASPHQRRVLWMTSLSGLGFFAFAVAYHQAVLPEAILMMTLPSLVIGVATILAHVWEKRVYLGWAGVAGVMVWAGLLIPQHRDFILTLTEDPTGLRSIQAAGDVPRTPLEKSILMMSWGPRYFAGSYSRLVTGENADLRMVDHRADFAALAAEGNTFYTEPDTLYGYPLSWWEARIGKVYLTSAGVNLVRLGTQPRLIENMTQENLLAYMEANIWLTGWELTCTDSDIILTVGWYAADQPDRDLSIKVHLTRTDSPEVLDFGDISVPVHGWRPTSSWLKHELVTDHYHVQPKPGAEQIILGMYEQTPDGSFLNYGETLIPLSACQ